MGTFHCHVHQQMGRNRVRAKALNSDLGTRHGQMASALVVCADGGGNGGRGGGSGGQQLYTVAAAQEPIILTLASFAVTKVSG